MSTDLKSNEIQIGFIEDSNVKALYNQLNNLLHGQKLTSSNIVTITLHLMQFVEKYPNIKGSQRKKIVIQVLKQFVADKVDDPTEEENILLIIQMTIPSLIDTIISVDKGEIAIKTKKCCESFFTCF